MTDSGLGDVLAHCNAALNFTSACFLVAGLYFVLNGDVDRHRKSMIGAVGASALFLVFYLTRVGVSGTHRFAGEGLARTAYLLILLSHMVLAVVIVPLILRLLFLAKRQRFDEHRRLARWTYPMWLYVSITGLTVYVMLYHVYGYA